jgi:hypothetical protein
VAAHEPGRGAQKHGQAAAVEDRAHGEEQGTVDTQPAARLLPWRRRGQVVVGAVGDVDHAGCQIGEPARDLAAREVGDGQDGARRAHAGPDQQPAAEALADGEVLRYGEERQVVDRGHARPRQRQRAGVRGGEDDVGRVAPHGGGEPALLPQEARARRAQAPRHDAGMVQHRVLRWRPVEVDDDAVVARARPDAEQVAQVASRAGRGSLQLAAVDGEDQDASTFA